MDPMMMLVVGWTLVGGFVFTMVVTLLSLVGLVRFADRRQQQKLFAVLLVELVLGVGAKALGAVRFDAAEVAHVVSDAGRNAAIVDVVRVLTEPAPGAATVDREQVDAVAGLLRPVPGDTTAADIAALRAQIRALPAGELRPDAANSLQRAEVLRRAPRELRPLWNR
ncbi:MAG: hypothetical protein JNK02_10485 [Planctomycetes bacterium]|nr:hypothetical protein [Planctomycetota bacterium]